MFFLATKRYVRRQIARMAAELVIKIADLGLEIDAVAKEAAGTVPADAPRDDAGDEATTGESAHRQADTNLVDRCTDEPNIPLDPSLIRFYEKKGYAIPSPGSTTGGWAVGI